MVLKIFKFLSSLFGPAEKWLDYREIRLDLRLKVHYQV